MAQSLTFYRPQMYVASYQADGTTIDTASVISLTPDRFTSDGITVSAPPITYDDETPMGTFTYDMGTTETNTASGVIKFANMKELAQLANNGTAGSDETHGMLEFGNPNACAQVKDRAVVIVDLCDTQNSYKMLKIDHSHLSLFTDDVTLGGSDPFQISFTVYAHPGGGTAAITFGTTETTKVFDPTTWTMTNPE